MDMGPQVLRTPTPLRPPYWRVEEGGVGTVSRTRASCRCSFVQRVPSFLPPPLRDHWARRPSPDHHRTPLDKLKLPEHHHSDCETQQVTFTMPRARQRLLAALLLPTGTGGHGETRGRAGHGRET